MPRAPRREQSSRKALGRLIVDHSPPPGSRKPKRQKIDRGVGSSSQAPITKRDMKSVETGLATVHGVEKDYSNMEAAAVKHDVSIKPPIKNKVQFSKLLVSMV